MLAKEKRALERPEPPGIRATEGGRMTRRAPAGYFAPTAPFFHRWFAAFFSWIDADAVGQDERAQRAHAALHADFRTFQLLCRKHPHGPGRARINPSVATFHVARDDATRARALAYAQGAEAAGLTGRVRVRWGIPPTAAAPVAQWDRPLLAPPPAAVAVARPSIVAPQPAASSPVERRARVLATWTPWVNTEVAEIADDTKRVWFEDEARIAGVTRAREREQASVPRAVLVAIAPAPKRRRVGHVKDFDIVATRAFADREAILVRFTAATTTHNAQLTAAHTLLRLG